MEIGTPPWVDASTNDFIKLSCGGKHTLNGGLSEITLRNAAAYE
jgi:hypothetical protein